MLSQYKKDEDLAYQKLLTTIGAFIVLAAII
jgi:hypothetical protein